MPLINRIRLVNVNYNDAKNIYDDFMMRLEGKSTTYDLKNTGGKSLLLLMLLQTVIPNTYLKPEKPVKNIFIGGNPKRTSHCLVEWILDDEYEYKYMLTGFCARKKQDTENIQGENKLEIDYYNYCYFYNNENQNDIKHLPLATEDGDEKVYMSYDKLRQLLGNLKKEGQPVEIFDSKKEYMKHISYYGLITAEWKLISEINVSENYIEKYFKENKTSRKLIENFLIKIIDNVNMQNNEEDENQLADTLIELKDNLMDFRKQSDNKGEYVTAKELYNNLKQKNQEVLNEFLKTDKINKKAYESYVFKKDEFEKLSSKIEKEKNRIEDLKNENSLLSIKNDKLKIDKLYYQLEKLEKEKNQLAEELKNASAKKDEAIKNVEYAKSLNEYVDYVEHKSQADQIQIQIDNLSKGEGDIEQEYQTYGYNYKKKLEEKTQELEASLKSKTLSKHDKEEAKKIAKSEENNARNNVSECKFKIQNIEKEIVEKQNEINGITQELTAEGKMEFLLNVGQSIEQEKERLENTIHTREQNLEKIENLKNENVQNQINIAHIENDRKNMLEKQKEAENKIVQYEDRKKSIENLERLFQAESIEKLAEKLEIEIQEKEKYRNTKQIERQIKQRKLELIEKYNMVVPNEDIFHLKESLENKCTYITTGIERLMGMAENERKSELDKNPFLIYSIFVDDESFQKIKNKQLEVEVENLVPIASVELLRSGESYKAENIIFPIQKDVYRHVDSNQLEEYKNSLMKKISSLDVEIENANKKAHEIAEYLKDVNDFICTYTEENVELIYKEKKHIDDEIQKIQKRLDGTRKSIENNIETIGNVEKECEKLLNEENELKEEIESLEELEKLQNKCTELREKKTLQEKDFEALKEILEEKSEIFANIESEIENLKNTILEIDMKKGEYSRVLSKMMKFKQTVDLQQSFEEIKNHFEALDEKMKSSHTELKVLQDSYKSHMIVMEKCQKSIEEKHYTIEYFNSQNREFIKIPDSQIEELLTRQKELEKMCESKNNALNEKEAEYNKTKGGVENSTELLKEKGVEYLEQERVTELNEIERQITENTMKIKVNNSEAKELTKQISEIDKQVRSLERECDGLETFIREKDIHEFEVNVSTMLSSEIYSYERIHKESLAIDRNVEKQKNEFSKYIEYIKESVREFYIKQDILDTLQEIKMPTKLEECYVIENGISTIIENLEEKIRHIEDALKRLEGYQENFMTKCFEKAETIVRDLEKLPGLSRIKIGGKDVNIIKLDLFEYEKEEKIRNIKNYIYQIVQEMEAKPEEMSKEKLNEKLSSKALVSQIVNMDKASVKLYKIEDIQEHSTYKRWEDDLGSDGQVNAIYFMFAVCIISYISMLTRREGSSKSKKVIIVDNPFGATSAVFLWNVMFSILKENNVQLIAPGHNINKEIISKFEVNYVLKQEFYEGNKKSVSVEKEIRTEDDLERMNFEVIEGKQQSMF